MIGTEDEVVSLSTTHEISDALVLGEVTTKLLPLEMELGGRLDLPGKHMYILPVMLCTSTLKTC